MKRHLEHYLVKQIKIVSDCFCFFGGFLCVCFLGMGVGDFVLVFLICEINNLEHFLSLTDEEKSVQDYFFKLCDCVQIVRIFSVCLKVYYIRLPLHMYHARISETMYLYFLGGLTYCVMKGLFLLINVKFNYRMPYTF